MLLSQSGACEQDAGLTLENTMATQDGCATAEWGWEWERANEYGAEWLLAISCARFILRLEGVPQL